MTETDPPRPDVDARLDAALDAVLPSLTAMSDDAAAASLRRTRTALAERRGRLQGGWPASPWRWVLPAAATLAAGVLATFALWPTEPATDGPRTVKTHPAPASATVPPPTSDVPVPPPERTRAASATVPTGDSGRRRGPAVPARSRPDVVAPARRPDPLIALMDAVQAIPDEAWDRGVTLVQSPVAVPRVSVEPIAIAPLETPPIVDAPAESTAPGEP